MTSSKHTPGPFMLENGRISGNGYGIADVLGHNTTEGRANASLFVTAPELLEALREAADQLQGWVNWKCPKKHVPEHQRYIDGIRALIAKAEGGAS